MHENLSQTRQAIIRPISIAVPLGVRPSELAASTSAQLKVNDRASFRIETGGHPLAAGLGSGTLEVGSDAVTGSLISGGSAFLRERAIVNGDLIAHGSVTSQNGTVVTGTLTQFATVPVKTWERDVDFPDATLGPVNLEQGMDLPLEPGSYSEASVKSGAKLRLHSGRYTFTSFKTEPQSEVYLRDSVVA